MRKERDKEYCGGNRSKDATAVWRHKHGCLMSQGCLIHLRLKSIFTDIKNFMRERERNIFITILTLSQEKIRK